VKGQKLFVRELLDSDLGSIASLYAEEGKTPLRGELEVIGKLVGEVAAHAAVDFRSIGTAEITSVFVSPALRKKHVGTVLLRELESLLKDRFTKKLIVRRSCIETDLFFLRVGFREDGEFLSRDLLFSSK